MANIICPKCSTESYFSLSAYKGPFRCMKCKETFNIIIENGELKSSQPINQQDAEKLNIKTFYK